MKEKDPSFCCQDNFSHQLWNFINFTSQSKWAVYLVVAILFLIDVIKCSFWQGRNCSLQNLATLLKNLPSNVYTTPATNERAVWNEFADWVYQLSWFGLNSLVNPVLNRCWKPCVFLLVPVFPVWYDSLVYLWRSRV